MIARQRGRGDDGPLLLLRQLDGRPGERISHLAIDGDLAQAWQALTGEPFRPHQALALSGLKRGEPEALRSANPAITMTGFLLLYATLFGDRAATSLVLAADMEAARELHATLGTINAQLPASARLAAMLIEPHARPARDARIFIATPDVLHNRMLRFHDRGWNLFWRGLRFGLLPDVHMYHGVAGAHLADLLLRLQRVAAFHNQQPPDLVATLIDIDDPQPALTALLGYPWRVISADDVPSESVTLALWRGAVDHLREAAEVAVAIQRQGYHVHVCCQPLETCAISPIIGDVENITIGAHAAPAHVLVTVGYPSSTSQLRRLLRSHYQAVVVVLGDMPHEQMLARHSASLLNEPATRWPELPANAYVTAQHILCAASELALTSAEVEAWGVGDIVNRLVDQEQLVDLPDPEVAWKPTGNVDDPYAEFSLLSSSGGSIVAKNEQGRVLGWLDPTGFERWTFPHAALPPGAGGLRVTHRDEETGSIALRLEGNGRRTYPLRRVEVTVRDERETRVLNSSQIGWGRVVVDEEVYGYREMAASGGPGEAAVDPPLQARWIAPACWFDLHSEIQPLGQFVGWSLAAALPLRVLAAFGDVVPCYSHPERRLYMVDSQPGGNGLAAWLYAHAEELLPLAYDIALACRNDPLLEPLSRVDMDWLLAFLGRRAGPAARSEERASAHDEGPRVLLTPAAHEPPAAPHGSKSSPAALRQPAANQLESMPEERAREGRASSRRPPPNQRDKRIRAARQATRAAAARQEPEPPAPGMGEHDEPATSAPEAPPTPPAERASAARAPDASSLIERLQRQRQQRAANAGPQPAAAPGTAASVDVEPRFAAGDKVFCLPYGDGVVQQSRIEDGRELLSVHFQAHGELTIDPSVSLVRKIEETRQPDDDLL
jgi:DEAD/DEAH box helicase domain-containing protein